MKRKFLEDLGLDKDVIDKILDENSSDIGRAKGDLDKITAERDKLQADVKDRDTQLETLKGSTGDVEAMKKEIEKLQGENKAKDEAHAAELKAIETSSTFEKQLSQYGISGEVKVKMIKALVADILENPEIEGEGEAKKIKGLEDRMKKLQESDDAKGLFPTQQKQQKYKGYTPAESSGEQGEKQPTSLGEAVAMHFNQQ